MVRFAPGVRWRAGRRGLVLTPPVGEALLLDLPAAGALQALLVTLSSDEELTTALDDVATGSVTAEHGTTTVVEVPAGRAVLARMLELGLLVDDGRDAEGAADRITAPVDRPGGGAPTLDISLLDGSRARSLRHHREFLIGRDLDNDLRVDDPSVSRHHVRLVPGRRGWEVINQGSNGLLVDGRPSERHRLHGPTVLTLGHQPDAPQVRIVPGSSPAVSFGLRPLSEDSAGAELSPRR